MTNQQLQKELRISAYVRCLPIYGAICLAYMIDLYAEHELYEECDIILDAIKGIQEAYGDDALIDMPTTFDDKTKEWMRGYLKDITGTDGSTIINNMPYYAADIERRVDEYIGGNVTIAREFINQ